jgi:hypothetical protein
MMFRWIIALLLIEFGSSQGWWIDQHNLVLAIYLAEVPG